MSQGSTKKPGTDHGLLLGLSDDDHVQYVLADGSRVITGTQRFGGVFPIILGGAGDTQMRFAEGANDYSIEMGNNANAFTRRMLFTSSDHADPNIIAFFEADGVSVTAEWNEGDDKWLFQKDISMNNLGQITDVVDPSAGTHVGDRDYNDARYLISNGSTSTLGATGVLALRGTATELSIYSQDNNDQHTA